MSALQIPERERKWALSYEGKLVVRATVKHNDCNITCENLSAIFFFYTYWNMSVCVWM